MANAKKKPAAKKAVAPKKAAVRTQKSAPKKSSTTRAAAAPKRTVPASQYTTRVQALVYVLVVLCVLFACLAFYRYP